MAHRMNWALVLLLLSHIFAIAIDAVAVILVVISCFYAVVVVLFTLIHFV